MALRRVTPGLKDKTLATSRIRKNRDIDLQFKPKPGTVSDPVHRWDPRSQRMVLVEGQMIGDIYKKEDAAAVLQSIENILLTNYFEKPYNPYFGANIRAMLFETVENYSEELVRDQITKAVQRHEPRATVLDVTFWDSTKQVPQGAGILRHQIHNSVIIKVEFKIDNYQESFVAKVNMNRLR
jgi:phage baseplate assembly protein W